MWAQKRKKNNVKLKKKQLITLKNVNLGHPEEHPGSLMTEPFLEPQSAIIH